MHVPALVPEKRTNEKYIAPHLRARAGNEPEEHTQIRRRIRGLLNRLSESNVESITGEISTIFQTIARSVASQIISEEILASCSGGPRGNEQYAAVFAAFVAGMACLVGIDFSAKFMASFAKCFEDEYNKEDNLSLRNLTLLLCYLCIFGVCSSDLIYDFLIILSKRLTEIDVSTILTVLQCCGMKIRADDPAAMKDFIVSVQNRANELKASDGGDQEKIYSKRMEFMLETICDIKNNKKRPKEDPAHHTRIKKWLQKLRVDDVLIRGFKWNKLLDPNKKGQWWLSGDAAPATDNVVEVANRIDKDVLETQRMLQLAAAQRMNTDGRRAIFCIIMSGEDYIDAFEKLLRLDLPGKQDREIMRVLLECCLQEKVFNKYYTVLASKLCEHDRNHKFTLQFCLWDQFKELESMQLRRSMHLAKFVAEMVASFTLSLAVLKTIELGDITQLTPKKIMHFRMFFESIFEYSDSQVWNIFTRVAVTPALESLREGIEFFIKEYILKADKALTPKFKLAKRALHNLEGVLM
ncbi:nucleolar MIF4G domain-containing protein 1-like [Neltuma alba]|uniref:nucleolar MIF4G domain-containing protein 1-like n=1 Tax=Neltuma alba TaxID=207710 RepID=UPI0010A48D86|nr:nucleolar MIF4G domain-containing protein 1-like [Prosopis alba]XP_028790504.1 nucleolar MIF4G domain-containing protein 1-like [Prosopis alba]